MDKHRPLHRVLLGFSLILLIAAADWRITADVSLTAVYALPLMLLAASIGRVPFGRQMERVLGGMNTESV